MLKIANYKEIIASEDLQRGIIKDEMAELKEKYGDERRTDITYAEDEIKIEDLIANEEMVVTISSLGYIKRTKTSQYRQQIRGGKGSKGSKTRDKDFVEHMFVVNNHDYLLLFTEMGRCFWIRGYEIPEGSKTGTGRVMQNLIRMPKEDKVKAYIRIEDLTDEEYINNNYIIFCTRKGVIKKTLVEQFSRIRTNGINAITINEGDMLMEVKLTNGENEIVIANRNGRAIRFPEAKVRSMGRSAAGVRGIKLDDENDFAVGMLSVKEDSQKTIFVVSENGFGKRSEIGEYRTTNRGGKGVKTMSVTEKTGKVAAIKAVSEYDDMMITTKDGIMIRLAVTDVRIMGRAAQGVKCINLGKKSSISDVAVIRRTEEEKRAEEEE